MCAFISSALVCIVCVLGIVFVTWATAMPSVCFIMLYRIEHIKTIHHYNVNHSMFVYGVHVVRHACNMSVQICACVPVHTFTYIFVFNTGI